MIKIMLQFNGKQLTLPINPEELEINQKADNTNIDIIGLGKATRKGEPGLISLSISSFFPGSSSYYYTGVKPKTCIDFIRTIWNADNTNNNVGKLVTSGLQDDLNMYFVIEGFDPDTKAGEEDDVYYTLKIKEYVPYGAKLVKSQVTGLKAARAQAVASTTKKADTSIAAPQVNTYTVESGDCLWNITQACCGDGSRWNELYNLNKSIISDPNLIYPGQVLTLPTGWSTPRSVTKLQDVSKSSSNTSNNSNTEGYGGSFTDGGGGRRWRWPEAVVDNEIRIIFTKFSRWNCL